VEGIGSDRLKCIQTAQYCAAMRAEWRGRCELEHGGRGSCITFVGTGFGKSSRGRGAKERKTSAED